MRFFLRFVVTAPYSVDVLWYTVVDALIEALFGVGAGVITGAFVPPGIGVSDDVNVNMFTTLMTALRCVTPVPVEEAFGC